MHQNQLKVKRKVGQWRFGKKGKCKIVILTNLKLVVNSGQGWE